VQGAQQSQGRRGLRAGCRLRARLAPVLAAAALACGPAPSPEPAPSGAPEPQAAAEDAHRGLRSVDARVETVASLQADLAAERHPGDGGGRAFLRAVTRWPGNARAPGERVELGSGGDGAPRLEVGDRARFEIVYEAGPLGAEPGAMLFLQPSPFWGWEVPQGIDPERPAYTTVRLSGADDDLETELLGGELLGVPLPEGLAPGQQVELVYGAGPLLAGLDRYAEREARIWLALDADGDGVRGLVDESPLLDVAAGPAALLQLRGPSTARAGTAVRYRLSVLDPRGNAGTRYAGAVRLRSEPPGLELPETLELEARAGGLAGFEAVAPEPGVYRIHAEATPPGLGPLEAVSNPLVVGRAGGPQLWGDFHGHSQLSDGTGTPEDYFRYARDVAALDAVALTDHDHWGMRFLDARPALWERIRQATADFHDPGRFVTVLGYEWTSWLHGHRHVLHFAEDGPLLSSLDPRYETPAQLWQGLAGLPALTFAHHSAGGPISTNWAYPPDPVLEPVTEVTSVHGSSEAPDAPSPIYAPVPGNFVRNALNAGYRLGFLGSGDSHDGHPGLTHLAAGSSAPLGGLAALLTGERSREAVLAALRQRHVYATNGPRIWLRVHIDGRPMGSVIEPSEGLQQLEIEAVGEAPIERVDLVRSGHVARVEGEGDLAVSVSREIPALAPGEYHYVRVVQSDGGAAWSSPIFVARGEAPAEAGPGAGEAE